MKKSLKTVSSTKLDRHYYQQCSYSKIWQDKQSQPDNTCKWKSIIVIISLQQIPRTGTSKIQGEKNLMTRRNHYGESMQVCVEWYDGAGDVDWGKGKSDENMWELHI